MATANGGCVVRVGDYDIFADEANKLGFGSYGTVYSGTNRFNDKIHVAAKKMTVETEFLDQGNPLKEVELLLHTIPDHDNIIKVHEFTTIDYEEDGIPMTDIWMVMDKGELGNLKKYSRREEVSLAVKVDIICQCVRAVQHLHMCKPEAIAHRDLKPENFVLTKKSENCVVVKLVDYGFARTVQNVSGQSVTMKSMAGTESYWAPEQVHQKAGCFPHGKSVDVFSLGLTLLAFLDSCKGVTMKPFSLEGKSLGYIMWQMTNLHGTTWSGFTPDIEKSGDGPIQKAIKNVLRKMLQPQPSDRITITEVMDRVSAIIQNFPELGLTPSISAPPSDTGAAVASEESGAHAETAGPSRIEPEAASPSRTYPEAAGPCHTQPEVADPSHIQPEAAGPSRTQREAAGPTSTPSEEAGPSSTQHEAVGPRSTQLEAAGVSRTHPEGADSCRTQPEAADPSRAQPEAAGPSRAQPEAAGPSPAQPEAAGPSCAQPEAAGPSRTQPESAGLSSTQPETAGPRSTQPESAGPRSTPPEASGLGRTQPEGADSSRTQPEAADPSRAQPEAEGPRSTQPEAAGPSHAQPEAAGPSRAQPEAAGPSRAEPEAASPRCAEPKAAGPSRIKDPEVHPAEAAMHDLDISDNSSSSERNSDSGTKSKRPATHSGESLQPGSPTTDRGNIAARAAGRRSSAIEVQEIARHKLSFVASWSPGLSDNGDILLAKKNSHSFFLYERNKYAHIIERGLPNGVNETCLKAVNSHGDIFFQPSKNTGTLCCSSDGTVITTQRHKGNLLGSINDTLVYGCGTPKQRDWSIEIHECTVRGAYHSGRAASERQASPSVLILKPPAPHGWGSSLSVCGEQNTYIGEQNTYIVVESGTKSMDIFHCNGEHIHHRELTYTPALQHCVTAWSGRIVVAAQQPPALHVYTSSGEEITNKTHAQLGLERGAYIHGIRCCDSNGALHMCVGGECITIDSLHAFKLIQG